MVNASLTPHLMYLSGQRSCPVTNLMFSRHHTGSNCQASSCVRLPISCSVFLLLLLMELNYSSMECIGIDHGYVSITASNIEVKG